MRMILMLLALAFVPEIDPNKEVMDTLETSDPNIQLVLYKDHTWEYRRELEACAGDSIFTEAWSDEFVNPYKIELKDMPYRVTLWLVDSVSGFHCPYRREVYSKFGWRRGRQHMGVDLPMPTGTPMCAAFDGRVRIAKRIGGYGNVVIIRHANGLETTYGHLSQFRCEENDWVHAGDVIGLSGNTGRSTGPHLHFETRYKGVAFDPQWLIDFPAGKLRDTVFVLKTKHLIPGCQYVPSSDEEEDAIYQSEEEARAEAEKALAELNARRYHTIRSGDTLGAIARRYGTTVTAICRLNQGLTSRTTLRVGRKIRVR